MATGTRERRTHHHRVGSIRHEEAVARGLAHFAVLHRRPNIARDEDTHVRRGVNPRPRQPGRRLLLERDSRPAGLRDVTVLDAAQGTLGPADAVALSLADGAV